jgi:hypothetical protein
MLKHRNPIHQCPPDRAIVLANRTCVYCATELTSRGFTKDHVIGRRFVPKGVLNGQWNLIVRACDACNHAKSDLEDDISAITLQADAWGQHPIYDPRRDAEARRKARSKSRRTNKSVGQSAEHFNIGSPFGPGAEMTFGFTSPPQLDEDRVYRLCLMQSQAFFYWITYNKTSGRGGFWPGGFFPLDCSVRSDWGNRLHESFMETVSNWELRVQATGADGNFKVAIRKRPAAESWSWAYEWNRNARIIGFFGAQAVAQELVDTLPAPEWAMIRRGNETTKWRAETPLSPNRDKMFSRHAVDGGSISRALGRSKPSGIR